MLAVIATSAGIARYSKFYRRQAVESGNRELALDGLRGMAALMVMTHHAALCCSWITTGRWREAQSPAFEPSCTKIGSSSKSNCSTGCGRLDKLLDTRHGGNSFLAKC